MALVDRDILRWSSGEQERVSGGVVLHLLNLNRLTAGIVMAMSMPVEEGDPLWLTLAEDDAIEECEKERSGFPHAGDSCIPTRLDQCYPTLRQDKHMHCLSHSARGLSLLTASVKCHDVAGF